MADSCPHGGRTKPNQNCAIPGDDGLPVQCVGPWAKSKHHFLRNYVEATKGVRSKYLTMTKVRSPGGAAFVDLFAGPGRARVRTTGEIIAGSPFIGLDHLAAPFTKVILGETDAENLDALAKRTSAHGQRVRIVEGDCNEKIDEILRNVPPYGLNLALIDPYSLRALHFDTLRKLALVERMDLVIHFSTMDINRNFSREREFITQFTGTDSWQETIKRPEDVVKLIDVLKRQLAPFGYEQERVRTIPVVQSTNVPIYHLVYASKNPLGNRSWKTIAKTTADGQTGWDF